VIAALIGVALGVALGLVLVPVLLRRRPTQRVSFRTADGPPLPHHLSEVIATARAAALAVVPRRDGFEVRGQPLQPNSHVLRVAIVDASRVTPENMAIHDSDSYDLPLVVALGLVPLFGPIVVELGGDSVRVDGTLDQHQLRHARAALLEPKLRALRDRLRR